MRVLRNPFLWAFLVGIVALTAIRPLLRRVPEPPPVLGRVGRFELVAASGKPYGSDDLQGTVYVASFFFTRCPSICPFIMKSVKRLQDEYTAQNVRGVMLVSISVDPEHDTPQALREYGREQGIDPERWVLLTGERDTIQKLLIEGFKVPMGEPETVAGSDLVDIVHTGKLVLVDGQGQIRGYYDVSDEGLEEVFHRSQRVAREAAR